MKVYVWPDGTWCYGDELEEMTHMSDDYQVHETVLMDAELEEWILEQV